MNYWHKVLGFYRDFLPSDSKTEAEGVWDGIEKVLETEISRMDLVDSLTSLSGTYGYLTVHYEVLDMTAFDFDVSPDMELDARLFPFDELVVDVFDGANSFDVTTNFTINGSTLTWLQDPEINTRLFITTARYKAQQWIDIYRNWFGFVGDPYDYYLPESIPSMMGALTTLVQSGPDDGFQKHALSVLAGIPFALESGIVDSKTAFTSISADVGSKITIIDSLDNTYDCYSKLGVDDLVDVGTAVLRYDPLSKRADGFDHIEVRPYISKQRSDAHAIVLAESGSIDLTSEIVDAWDSDIPANITKVGGSLNVESTGLSMYLENAEPVILTEQGFYEWAVKFDAEKTLPSMTMTLRNGVSGLSKYDDRNICSQFMDADIFADGRFYDQNIRFNATSSDWVRSNDAVGLDHSHGLLGITFPIEDYYVQHIIGGLPYSTAKALYVGAYVNGAYTISIELDDETVLDTHYILGGGEYQLTRMAFTTPADKSEIYVKIKRSVEILTSIPNNDFSLWTGRLPTDWTVEDSILANRWSAGPISQHATGALLFSGRRATAIVSELSSALTDGARYIFSDESTVNASAIQYSFSIGIDGTKVKVTPNRGFIAGAYTHVHIDYRPQSRQGANAIIGSVSLNIISDENSIIELDMAMVGNPEESMRKRFYVGASTSYPFVGRISFDGFVGDSDKAVVLNSWKLYQLKRMPYISTVSSIDGAVIHITDEQIEAGDVNDDVGDDAILIDGGGTAISGNKTTVELQFYLKAKDDGTLLDLHTAAKSYIRFKIDADGYPVIEAAKTALLDETFTGAEVVTLGKLHHIALRWDGGTLDVLYDHASIGEVILNADPEIEMALPHEIADMMTFLKGKSGDPIKAGVAYARVWSDKKTNYQLIDNRNRRVRGVDGLGALDQTNLKEVWEFDSFKEEIIEQTVMDDVTGLLNDAVIAGLTGEASISISGWVAPRDIDNGIVAGWSDGTAVGTGLVLQIIKGKIGFTISDAAQPLMVSDVFGDSPFLDIDKLIFVELVWSAAGLFNLGSIKYDVRIYVDQTLVGISSLYELGLTMATFTTPAGVNFSVGSDKDANGGLAGKYSNFFIQASAIDSDLASTGASLTEDADLVSPPNIKIWQPSRDLKMYHDTTGDTSYRFVQKYSSAVQADDLKAGAIAVLFESVPGEVYKFDLKANFLDNGAGHASGPGTMVMKLKGTTMDAVVEADGGVSIKANNEIAYDDSFLLQATGELIVLVFETSTRYDWITAFYKIEMKRVSSAKQMAAYAVGSQGDYDVVGVTGVIGALDAYFPMLTGLADGKGTGTLAKVGTGTARITKVLPSGKTTAFDGSTV